MALDDPARIHRLEVTVYGVPADSKEGLVDTVARHERQIYGNIPEGVKGLLPRMTTLEAAFNKLVQTVADMSDGKKTLLTLLGLGVTSLTGLGTLVASAAALIVALGK